VTYQIAVDGFEGAAGDIKFSLDLGATFPVPANDNFANRIPLTGSSITTNVSNVGATYEANEPMHLAIFGGRTVWFRWTAPASGGVTLTASNNALDTLVAVYTGTSVSNLTFVAGNDEDYFLSELVEGDSTAYFNAVSGTTYVIAVDGVDGAWGPFQLRLTLGTADPVPANNNFANSVLISGTNTTVTGSNLGATLEPGEPLHRGYYGGSSVWWRWVAPGPGMVTIDTSNNIVDAPDTLLAVYTGTSVSTLTEIASDNNSGGTNWTSLVAFPTKSNVTYRIAVDGYDGDAWNNLKLRVRFGLAAYSLNVLTNPGGAGTVSVNPAPDQAGKYAPGSVVTLTASPAAGNTFAGWTGNVSSTNNPLVVAVISNLTVSADFVVTSTTTKIWTGASPASGNWTDNLNWNSPPIAGDNLIFPPGAQRRSGSTNDFPANTIFNSITLGGDDYVLRGNAISLTGSLLVTNATGTNTVQPPVQLSSSLSFCADSPTGTLLVSGNVNLGAHTLTAEATGNIILSGAISGAGGLVKTNAGILRLAGSNANSFGGTTTVNQGTLVLAKTGGAAVTGALVIGDGVGGADADVVRLEAAQQISAGAITTVNSSGLWNLNDASAALAALAGGGHVEFGGANAVLTVGAGNAASSFSGLLTGAGQLIKTGTGTFTLTANNTYTGQTTVSNGTLIVNGTQAGSAVAVYAPAVLGGIGRVGNLSGSGTVSPGNSPGQLSSGNVGFATNSTLRVELNGSTLGSGYDQLNVSGSVSLAGNLHVTLGFTPAVNDNFTIIDNNGNDAVVGTFNNLPQNSHLVFGGTLLRISYSAGAGANNVVLTRVAPVSPTITSLTPLPNAVQIQGSGQAGLTYVLETAASLAAPIAWTPVGTNTAAANGIVQLTHANAPALPARFYRVRWP
jgi:autotransporter-associated beta strand protein